MVNDMSMELVERIKEFIENEMRSCSMDISGITPVYVYRMWGGKVQLELIEEAFRVNASRIMVND